MTLDQLCCSIESAKKLRELGFKKESYFYYFEDRIYNEWDGLDELVCSGVEGGRDNLLPAYTAAELLEDLSRRLW